VRKKDEKLKGRQEKEEKEIPKMERLGETSKRGAGRGITERMHKGHNSKSFQTGKGENVKGRGKRSRGAWLMKW